MESFPLLMVISSLGQTGWVSVDEPREFQAILKIEERDGRAVIVRLMLAGDSINSAALRAYPIGRVEAMLNKNVPVLIPGPANPAAAAEDLEAAGMFPDHMRDIESMWDEIVQRKRSRRRLGEKPPKRERLTRPTGEDPEGFSRRVAAAYQEAALVSRAPAKALAKEANVPVTTVHRWILDARRRGLIAPARRGRAG